MHEGGFFSKVMTPGTRPCAVACVLLGVLTALMLLWAGVWKTLLVAILIALGIFLGGVKDKRTFFQKLLGRNDMTK